MMVQQENVASVNEEVPKISEKSSNNEVSAMDWQDSQELASFSQNCCSQSSGEVYKHFTEPKKKHFDILTVEVCMALDRTGTSSRNALFIINAILQSIGIDINDICLSHSSIHRRREEVRKTVAFRKQINFPVEKITTSHWDGKLLLDLSGKEKVDRLPIIATGEGVEEILNVPKLDVGSGKA